MSITEERAAKLLRLPKQLNPMLRSLMEEHKWVVTGVPGLSTYSIGFIEQFDHPEICMAGLRETIMYAFIRMVYERLAKGERFEPGKNYDNFSTGYPCQFIKVHPANFENWFAQAKGYNGPDTEMLQMVWTDTQGKFPWEEGFEERFRDKQVLLNVDQRHIYDLAPDYGGCPACEEQVAIADGDKPKRRSAARQVH